MATSRREVLRTTLERFAGPHAFNPWVGLIVLLPLSVGTALADVSNTGSNPIVWIRVAVAAFLVSLALFLVVGLVVRWVRPIPARIVIVALAYGAVESTRAIFVEWSVFSGDVLSAPGLPFRIIAGFTTGLALFALASTFVGDSLAYRSEMAHLRQQEDKLRHLLSRSVAELANVRREILRDVRDTVDEAIREVLRRSGTQATAQEVVDTLIEVSSDVIRPLSHDLQERPRRFPEPLPEHDTRRFHLGLRDSLAQVTRVAPFRPWATVIFGMLLVGPVLAFTLPPAKAILFALAFLTAIAVILGLADVLARRYFGRIRAAWRTVIMFAVFMIMGSVLGAVVYFADVANYESPGPLAIYCSIIGVLVGWMLAMPPGLREARNVILSETVRVNDSLRWELARANARVWQEQQELSSVLHRDIQGGLLAAAFRLNSVIESGGDTVAAIDEVRTIVTNSVELISRPSGPRTLHALFAELTERWDGVLAIATSYPSATRQVVEKDAVVMRAIRDITTEFATNSVKHGRAHGMRVDVRNNEGSSTLTLTLTNDGRPLAEEWTPGLGTMLITNLATRVSTSSSDSGLTIVAELPTGPATVPTPGRLFIGVPR